MLMATIQELQTKVEKAQEKVEKCKKTIERHKKALEKKQQVLIKMGYDISDLNAIKWKPEGGGSDCYWEVCDVESKERDIVGATKKLAEAEGILERHQQRLDVEIEKDRFIAGEAPQVIKDFLEKWKQLAYEWHINRYNKYQEFKKKIDAEVKKAYEELGIQRSFFPSKSQEKALKEMELDYHTVQQRKNSFAGSTVLYMDTLYREEERNAWLEKELEKEKKAKMIDLINRINHVVGTITDASKLKISVKGNLDGMIIGDKGRAKVQTVGAGGWNIQCFHYRTLVHPLKANEVYEAPAEEIEEVEEEVKQVKAVRVNKTEGNLKTVWNQLDNASGELYNALDNLARMVDIDPEAKRLSNMVDITAIDALKNYIEELVQAKGGDVNER